MADGTDEYWSKIEPFWDVINLYDGPEAFQSSCADIPRAVVYLYAAYICQFEICNGGFLQFFLNSTGVLAPEAIAAFRELGMPLTATLVETACSALGEPYPRERQQRKQAIQERSGPVEEPWRKGGPAFNEYKALEESGSPMAFTSQDKQFYALLDNESGGFEQCADSYAASIGV